MAALQDILYGTSIRSIAGDTGIAISGLAIDSRRLKPGYAFVAIRGSASDGHQYIDQAIRAGASAIVCEVMPASLQQGITYVQVEDSALAAGIAAHQFYGRPSEKLRLVGVTGTNGKTTVATLLYQLFTDLGYGCGLISTVRILVRGMEYDATHTTPDAITLNALLAEMVEAGCSHAFMETSSHAIHQHRVSGLRFAGGIFTNITHDHLDYHKTFDEYIRVKKRFFDGLPAEAFALSNADDKRGKVMLQNTAARPRYYSLKTLADFRGRLVENSLAGLVMMIDDQEVHFRLIGAFNAYNLLAAYGAAVCLGEENKEVLRRLSALQGAEGRFEYQVSPRDRIVGIVDYAHTPDALVNVLETIRGLRKGYERVITVVGCGGDRDRAKRPLMAEAAASYSEQVVMTSDNPRSEDPQAILQDMEKGLNSAGKRKTLVVPDRREAIKLAVTMARPEDIVLVAGKGHEKYQEIKGVKYPFDDKQVLLEMFAVLGK